MIVVLGCIFVLAAVLTGFSMAGGHVGALIHPSELVTIGGAALGSMIIMSPRKVLMDVLRGGLQAVKGTPYNKNMYIELFGLIFALCRVCRREGVLALESHITSPLESPTFQKHPLILKNKDVTQFLCTAMNALVDNSADITSLNSSLEGDIRLIEQEHHAAVGVLTKTADALPGFGIVAAVLGIVVTMQAIGGPVQQIGEKVGAALVGTFLGILLSYGFFAPLATRLEFLGEAQTQFLRTMSVAVIAMGQGGAPKAVVTQACRSVSAEFRPTPADLNRLFTQDDTK
jgi:chemotaxis protein MotA